MASFRIPTIRRRSAATRSTTMRCMHRVCCFRLSLELENWDLAMPVMNRSGEPAIHYVVDDFTDPWKKAPVLLLQHGNGRNGKFWYRWIPHLARHYKVVRPDMRGLGQSGRDFDLQRDLTLDALIGDLKALISELGGGPVHFCGESMGGILGCVLTALHPELIRTLTIVATPVFINEDMKQRYSVGHGSRTDAMKAMGT